MPEGTFLDVREPVRRELPRLPDQITVNFGPTAAVAEYILAADREMRRHGIRLSLSTDFAELAELNRKASDWYRLPTWFDPAYGEIPDGQGFWLRGVDEDNVTAVTQAERLYLCDGSTFKDEVESLRMIYSDVARRADTRTRAEVMAPIGREMTGRISTGGGLWIRKDFRGKGLAYTVSHLARIIVLTSWYSDYHTCLVQQDKAQKMPQVYGYRTHAEHGVRFHHLPGRESLISCALCWATPEDTIELLHKANEEHHAKEQASAFAGAAE